VLTIFDRYLVREILLPFFLGLLILTFILLMPPILENAQQLIAKGVDFPTVFRILLTLTPQALSVTIPMALLYGILMGGCRRIASSSPCRPAASASSARSARSPCWRCWPLPPTSMCC
jgi:lipopolysaccharide export system permease LptF/LptG-like protein